MQHLSGPASYEHPGRHDEGVFAAYDLPNAMAQFLNMNIDDALSSENPLIRAIAIIDRRTGKRRIELLDPSSEIFPVSTFIRLRQAELGSAG